MDVSSNPTRRKVMTTFGVGGIGLIAGCSAIEGLTSSPPQLGEVYVENRHTTPGVIDVVIEEDGEQVHTSTHEIEGADDSGQHLAIEGEYLDHTTWADSTGDFVIKASLTGGDDWTDMDLSEYGDADCYSFIVRRDGEDHIRFLSTPNCEPVGNNPYRNESRE